MSLTSWFSRTFFGRKDWDAEIPPDLDSEKPSITIPVVEVELDQDYSVYELCKIVESDFFSKEAREWFFHLKECGMHCTPEILDGISVRHQKYEHMCIRHEIRHNFFKTLLFLVESLGDNYGLEKTEEEVQRIEASVQYLRRLEEENYLDSNLVKGFHQMRSNDFQCSEETRKILEGKIASTQQHLENLGAHKEFYELLLQVVVVSESEE